MRRLLFLILLVGLLMWRNRLLEQSDRTNGYGRYADIRPVRRD